MEASFHNGQQRHHQSRPKGLTLISLLPSFLLGGRCHGWISFMEDRPPPAAACIFFIPFAKEEGGVWGEYSWPAGERRRGKEGRWVAVFIPPPSPHGGGIPLMSLSYMRRLCTAAAVCSPNGGSTPIFLSDCELSGETRKGDRTFAPATACNLSRYSRVIFPPVTCT